jgi:hypothetical protein
MEGWQFMRLSWSVSLAFLVLLSLALLPHAVVAQGNSGNAHLCQDGGYTDYVGVTGGVLTFLANPGECVNFAAQGGQLVAVAPVQPCLDGGYASYTTSPGGAPFTSEADCVIFVAQGEHSCQ